MRHGQGMKTFLQTATSARRPILCTSATKAGSVAKASLQISESRLPVPSARKQLLWNKTKGLCSVVCERFRSRASPDRFAGRMFPGAVAATHSTHAEEAIAWEVDHN